MAELKLVKFKTLFLSPFFLPRSPHSSYWDDIHFHIPPSTLSGYLFRVLTYMMDRYNVRGDYLPCEIGKGLLAKVNGTKVEWYIAEREEVVAGFKPPYMEFHFNAVSLGAYPASILNGNLPKVYSIVKYWNVIKYIDVLIRGVEKVSYDVVRSIKTWHYAVMDGIVLNKRRINLYEVVKVTHVLAPELMTGFALVSDATAEELFRRLSSGWFIMKTRMKNLLAVKVDEVLKRIDYKGAESPKILPTTRRPTRFNLMFASNVLDIDAIKGSRRNRSVVEAYLYVPSRVDNVNDFIFFGNGREVYAVDRMWLEAVEGK